MKYENKEQILDDAKKILKYDLSEKCKRDMLNTLLWRWSEFDGKYWGCKYWSEEALKDKDKKRTEITKNFRHEHIVPRKLIIDYIIRENIEENKLEEIFKKWAIATVVTLDEDKELSKNFKSKMPIELKNIQTHNDIWSRYREVGIKVYKVKWNDYDSKRLKKWESSELLSL